MGRVNKNLGRYAVVSVKLRHVSNRELWSNVMGAGYRDMRETFTVEREAPPSVTGVPRVIITHADHDGVEFLASSGMCKLIRAGPPNMHFRDAPIAAAAAPAAVAVEGAGAAAAAAAAYAALLKAPQRSSRRRGGRSSRSGKWTRGGRRGAKRRPRRCMRQSRRSGRRRRSRARSHERPWRSREGRAAGRRSRAMGG